MLHPVYQTPNNKKVEEEVVSRYLVSLCEAVVLGQLEPYGRLSVKHKIFGFELLSFEEQH